IAGLWLATGHHRNGVLLAAITAELLAARLAPEASGSSGALTDEETSHFLQAFRWDRFAPGAAPAGRTPPEARAHP
ncbi:MAG TPA: hypothetical protein VER57_02535, partial [Cyanobium sp.]|nr:hypothetical protein [Cyanobium sp.]